MTATKPNLAARDFTDDGTGRSFLKDEEVVAKPGEMANYHAAGLIAQDEPAPEAAGDGAGSDPSTDGKPSKPKA